MRYKILMGLLLLLIVPTLASAEVFYEYGCEDNDIANSNFSSGALTCNTTGAINGTYAIYVGGGTTYSSLDLSLLGLPANYNISFYTNASNTVVPTGNPSGTCPSNNNASNACYSAGGGLGLGYDETQDPNYYNMKTGASAGGNIGTITKIRYEQIGTTTYNYIDEVAVDNWVKTPIVFQVFQNRAGFEFFMDNLCIYNGTDEDCFPPPGDPYLDINIQNIHDNANIENLTVTLSDGTSNTTDSNGIAHFENKTTQSFNVTDPNGLYFDYNSSVNPTENATTTYNDIYGAFVTLIAVNTTNNSISTFNVTSALQSNTTTTGSLRLYLTPNASNEVNASAPNYRSTTVTINTTPQDLSSYNFTLEHDTNLSVEAYNIDNSSQRIAGFCARVNNSVFTTSKCSLTNETIYFDAEFPVGTYNITTYSVGVGDGTSGSWTSNTTQFLVNGTVNASLASTELQLILTFLDEETRASMNGTNVSVSVIDSTGNITDFVTDTGNISITGIFEEGDYTVRYTAENFSLRDFFFTLSLDDPVTEETLYLLRSSVFTPGIVSVRNFDGTNIEAASVDMKRYYGNDTIPNLVQSGTTDVNGDVVFVAESVTAFYTFSVEVNGVNVFNESVPQLLTVDNTGLFRKTIVLERSGLDETNQNTGFLYTFSPTTVLINNTVQGFNTTINSSSWELTACTFNLYNADGTLLNTTNGFCSASTGLGELFYNISSTDDLYTQLIITTSLFSNTYTQYYSVYNNSFGNYTLNSLAEDISAFSGAGFNNFTRFLISIMVIMGVTFMLAGGSNFINNPEEMVFLMFIMSLGFSYIDWMNLGLGNLPIPAFNQWGISIIIGLVAVVMGFRKFGVNE